jgi:hypothetical protein
LAEKTQTLWAEKRLHKKTTRAGTNAHHILFELAEEIPAAEQILAENGKKYRVTRYMLGKTEVCREAWRLARGGTPWAHQRACKHTFDLDAIGSRLTCTQAPVLMPCGSPVVCALARQNQPCSVCGCVLTVSLVAREGTAPRLWRARRMRRSCSASRTRLWTSREGSSRARGSTPCSGGRNALQCRTICRSAPPAHCAARPSRYHPGPFRSSTRAPARSAPRSWPTTRACARAHAP